MLRDHQEDEDPDCRQKTGPSDPTRHCQPGPRGSHGPKSDGETETNQAQQCTGGKTRDKARSPSLDLTKEDEEQTEKGERAKWAEEYDLMIQEKRAEANYLAEYQEELEIEEAMEAHESGKGQNK